MRPMRIVAVFSLVLATAGLLAVMSGAPRATAQVATPVANPFPAGVPCTNLFGIAIGNACLLALNGSPETGPVDLYIDGQLAVAGMSFGVLGEFIPVTAGERQIQVVPSGGAIDDALIGTRVALAEAVAYEVSVSGTADALQIQAIPIDTSPLPSNTSRLRIVHASPDAPEIDLALTGGENLFEGVEYRELTGYVPILAGNYDLEARVAGTTDLALPLPGIVMVPNTTYTLHVIGLVDDGSLGAVLVPVLISPDIAGAVATPVG